MNGGTSLNSCQRLLGAHCAPGAGLSASGGLAYLLAPHDDPSWLHERLIMVAFKLCV